MTSINPLEMGAAAKARTNMLKLPGDLDDIIDRLAVIDEGYGHIQAARTSSVNRWASQRPPRCTTANSVAGRECSGSSI